jgi:fibronectin type III domain protein
MAHKVVLTWNAPTTGDPVATYDVKRAPAPSGVIGTYVSIGSPTATTFEDDTVVAGQEYAYEVAAVNAAGESAFTAAFLATIPLAAPGAPSGLTGTIS